VIEGAGGRITDWQGRPLGFDAGAKNGHVLAAGDPGLHAQAVRHLSTPD
jgi:myo-inositol-1(or 4)-monophosphatase